MVLQSIYLSITLYYYTILHTYYTLFYHYAHVSSVLPPPCSVSGCFPLLRHFAQTAIEGVAEEGDRPRAKREPTNAHARTASDSSAERPLMKGGPTYQGPYKPSKNYGFCM